MAKLVKEIRPETRKTLILALVCLCIVVCSAFSGFTVAKYQRQLADDEHSIPASEFYFTSDILRDGGNNVTIYEWNKSAYAFNIYNYDIMDEDKISTFNLKYSLAISSVTSGTFSNGTYTSGGTVTGTVTAKIGSTTQTNLSAITMNSSATSKSKVATQCSVTVTPSGSHNAVRFTLTATSATYAKTLTATVTLVTDTEATPLKFEIADSANATMYTAKITVAPNTTYKYAHVTITWNSSIAYPDMTEELYLKANVVSTNSVKVCLATGGYYEWRFFKQPGYYAQNYTIASLGSGTERGGIKWSSVYSNSTLTANT